jgi:hypothetical protein
MKINIGIDKKRTLLWGSVGLAIIISIAVIVHFTTKDGFNDNGDCKPDCSNAEYDKVTNDGCGGKCAAFKCSDGKVYNNETMTCQLDS